MPLDDEIREMYRTMRDGPVEKITQRHKPRKNILKEFFKDFNQNRHHRKFHLWQSWEDELLLKIKNNKRASLCLFRTIRAVHERRKFLKHDKKVLLEWRNETRVMYKCDNCGHIDFHPGQCNCKTFFHTLIPPENETNQTPEKEKNMQLPNDSDVRCD